MSKALQCDRCGNFYNPMDVGDRGRFLSIRHLTWSTAESYSKNCFDAREEGWDFCPKCTKDFAKFMDEKSV